MSQWLYLHYPSLQLDSAFCGRNEQAIIIVQGSKNEVVQLNSAAMAQGVKVGMGLGTASALCTNLSVHAYNPEIEITKLKELSQWLYLVTSDITFFEPDGILLRISNMLLLYGGLREYWQMLESHMQPLCLSYQFASGCSPLASRLLARVGANCIYPNKETSLNVLKIQPLHSSDLPKNVVEKLSRIGVKTLGDLLDIPMADIARRFDIELVNYVGRVTGQFKHPVAFFHPPEVFVHYLELLFEVENTQWLSKPLEKLLGQLEGFLKLQDKLAHELLLMLHQRDAEPMSITVSSAAGEYQAIKWLPLFLLRLESVVLSAPVTGITLKAERIAERLELKTDLFDGKRGNQSPHELVSFLQAKLGKQAVRGISLTDDPRPQRASQNDEPLISCKQIASKQIAINPHLIRPTLLLPYPKPLTMQVSIMQGPERIVTGWWDSKPIHRDYFVARSLTGQSLWVFRNHKHQWFIHGMFS
ncbi:Y-family DNA polymerase [Paraglaciecola hydrolytica]|uniref:Nucleotidyltransferase n=1 Tax=Paraglaciecola hydrolytica TaxID=1799789 RepID=A0A136A587_9ALTE|nr:DNA polymerase Y family protein [Paraglaciecola hydrolytica]KXI30374.1 nucleotidyltransferase [Paraglaciecola hydrolytica]